MKQIVQARPRRSSVTAPITIQPIPNMPESATLVKEVETTTVIRERTYLIPRPVCMHCGEAKERVIGAYFECVNEDCPSNDPKGGASAIPLREEGKKLIDVKPIARRAA